MKKRIDESKALKLLDIYYSKATSSKLMNLPDMREKTMFLQDKKILLCVSGGIAAYKAIELASMLRKQGAQIRTIMTASAMELISPVNFEAVAASSVHTSLWKDNDPIPHINLADWADLIVVAPATANIIAKAAYGIADDLLSTTILAANSPIVWIPAMNSHMYNNAATQDNLSKLKARGHLVMEPVTGLLACGYEGKGKYPPNEDLVYAIRTYLQYGKDLVGKRVLVSAGACSEDIDPMRCITNKSSGKMGIAIARAASLRGAYTTLVHANISVSIPYHLDKVIQTKTAEDMLEAMLSHNKGQDFVIMCAAVSDYKVSQASTEKIKKGSDLMLSLTQTPDVLMHLSEGKEVGQRLVGFAAETQDLIANAKAKLNKKNLDLIVANHLDRSGQDDSHVYMIDSDETIEAHGDKYLLAHAILDRISSL